MAQQPQLPMQMGQNLPGLETEQNIQKAQMQDAEMDMYEEALGLDPKDVEQEVIEMEDGSIVVNFTPKESPKESPQIINENINIVDIHMYNKFYVYSLASLNMLLIMIVILMLVTMPDKQKKFR